MTEQLTALNMRPRGWNLRRDVTLECPSCGRTQNALPDPTDPPRTAKVRVVCDRCPDDAAVVDYFDSKGRQIGPNGRPLTAFGLTETTDPRSTAP